MRGDLEDASSLRAAFAGAYGVFSVQPSAGQPECGITDADEARFGMAVADAARAAGVEHVMYTSAAGAGPNTGVGHFSAKWQIEEHIRGLDLDSTILRPTAFMEILLQAQLGLANGELTFFMRPDRPVQFIAVEDIGRDRREGPCRSRPLPRRDLRHCRRQPHRQRAGRDT